LKQLLLLLGYKLYYFVTTFNTNCNNLITNPLFHRLHRVVIVYIVIVSLLYYPNLIKFKGKTVK